VALAPAQCRGSNQRWPTICVGIVVCWLSTLLALLPAHAQSGYPDRPVRILVPYGPGGVADVTMRIVAQRLSERLGQQFVVENRPGAGGIIAAQAGISAPPDGYTLSLTGNYNAISMSLFKSLPYDVLRDFTQISSLAYFDMLVATRAKSPLNNVKDIIAAVHANPKGFNFGSVAPGSTQNLAVELFKLAAGLDAQVVIYRTTPELMAGVLRGDVDVQFDFYAALQGAVRDHELKVLATGGPERMPWLPDVPTVAESGVPGYEVTSWNGLSGPVGLPEAIVTRLNHEINQVLQEPDVQAKARGFGILVRGSTPQEMQSRLRADVAKWATVIDKTGLAKQ
jgi:tripartite-type tricarboxylate transporter receptor subunit TctC